MIYDKSHQGGHTLRVDGIEMEFLLVRDGTMVSTHTFHTLFESHENCWGTMVKLGTLGVSSAKEISLLTLSSLFQMRTSPQGSTTWCLSTLAI